MECDFLALNHRIYKVLCTICSKFQALTRKFQRSFIIFISVWSYSCPKSTRCHVHYPENLALTGLIRKFKDEGGQSKTFFNIVPVIIKNNQSDYIDYILYRELTNHIPRLSRVLLSEKLRMGMVMIEISKLRNTKYSKLLIKKVLIIMMDFLFNSFYIL